VQYAATQNNLGSIYLFLAESQDPEENFLKAAQSCREALKIYSSQEFPEDYAETQGNLWAAYIALADLQERRDCCRQALEAAQQRSRVYRKFNPFKYASSQRDLAITYIMLASTEMTSQARGEDCHGAIEACREALTVFAPASYPMEYAEVENLLWTALTSLAEIDDKVEDRKKDLKKAAKACVDALEIYLGRSPSQWAEVQRNLACTYLSLAELEDKSGNCQRAIEAYRNALDFRPEGASLLEQAEIEEELGDAYLALSEAVDREENCQMALKAYKRAHQIFTKEAERLESEGDSKAAEALRKAEGAKRSQEAAKKMLKSGKARKSE
jgi:tetratricopeptide (TPR) repeat protein